jgi:nucleoside-diphosphate-sugar epimerase
VVGTPIKHYFAEDSGFEIKQQKMDSSFLFEQTGWAPKNNFASKIYETVEWYLKNL